MKLASVAAWILCCAFSRAASAAEPPRPPQSSIAGVTETSSTLVVLGENFYPAPRLTVGGILLSVSSATSTEIIASKPGLPPGSYLLIVTSGQVRSTASLSLTLGEVGPTGATGAIGPDGAVGPQGPIGETGPIGPQGPMGPQGLQGFTGQQGPPGPQGVQGQTGPQGLVGPQGPIGPMGPIGPIGPQGPAGASIPADAFPGGAFLSLADKETLNRWSGDPTRNWRKVNFPFGAPLDDYARFMRNPDRPGPRIIVVRGFDAAAISHVAGAFTDRPLAENEIVSSYNSFVFKLGDAAGTRRKYHLLNGMNALFDEEGGKRWGFGRPAGPALSFTRNFGYAVLFSGPAADTFDEKSYEWGSVDAIPQSDIEIWVPLGYPVNP